MPTDAETNFVFLSDRLQFRRPFWKRLTGILELHAIPFGILKGTKDIWCVDYMPIQIDNEKFIQFKYNPDYLQHGKWRETITDTAPITSSIEINTIDSDLSVDGGNVVRGKNWVILTEKVFLENSNFDRRTVLRKLESALEVRPIIIPSDPDDFTGHADGLVRHYDCDTVLVNRYDDSHTSAFNQQLRHILKNEGLRLIDVPYNPYGNASHNSAKGIYINYLEMKNFLLLPTFDLPEDDEVSRLFEQLFPGTNIATINSSQIAKDGGVLNCITWNIKL